VIDHWAHLTVEAVCESAEGLGLDADEL
jgi:hypothetical protein